MAIFKFLDKENTIAKSGFNRWLVPPAALAIHLCIGMAYGFSVFWLPLSKAVGISAPLACPAGMSFFGRVFAPNCDWPVSMIGWTYTLFFVFLGSSAATFGKWLEHAGPRKAAFISALCWSGGLLIAALGVYIHQIMLLWLGAGVIGGIGLGLGYISPVSTLVKWFPDRRGMATGMAIMGFGGGAMIGAPLADRLMNRFASANDVGVWQTFIILAAIYLLFMTAGALLYRVPPSGWKPEGWQPAPGAAQKGMVTGRQVHVSKAWRTPQFWLLWGVLLLNVSAGIGVIGMASPLLQEVFGGRLIGLDTPFSALDAGQKTQIAAVAAGFTGLLSLFNIAGRFIWASLSDRIGRKPTYFIFFALGLVLYASVPALGRAGSLALFVLAFCVIVSMYGGGFAAIPAYLADLFGTQMVGAIHGRLLTAWSTAGVLGPVLVNYIRDFQLAHGAASARAYDATMYILAGFLALGFICNLLVKPVDERHFMTEAELAKEKQLAHDQAPLPADEQGDAIKPTKPTSPALVAGAWAAVGLPLLYGLWNTLQKAIVIFR